LLPAFQPRDIDDMAGYYMWGCVVHRERASCLGDKYHKCMWEKSTNSCWVDVGFAQSYFAKNYMCQDNDITLFTRWGLPGGPAAAAALQPRNRRAPSRAPPALGGVGGWGAAGLVQAPMLQPEAANAAA
jgi:hypothetical protein